MFTIVRRNDRLPEPLALTELRRASSISAARRIAHEVAFRFFEAADALGSLAAQRLMADVLRWDGSAELTVALDGHRFYLCRQ